MESIEKQQNVYLIESILLTESNYRRASFIDFSISLESNLSVNIETGGDIVDDHGHFIVVVAAVLKGHVGDEFAYEVSVKMVGVFLKIGDPELSLESFKKINAPAIIYPFIREHIHNLNSKAGINNIVLPPVNFYKSEIITPPLPISTPH